MALTTASASPHPGGTVAVGAADVGAEAWLEGADDDPDSLGFTTNMTTRLSATTASTANAMVIQRDPCIRSLRVFFCGPGLDGMAKKLPGVVASTPTHDRDMRISAHELPGRPRGTDPTARAVGGRVWGAGAGCRPASLRRRRPPVVAAAAGLRATSAGLRTAAALRRTTAAAVR